MLNWLLTQLINCYEKRCKKQMGGIPLLWVIYQEDKPKPNIVFQLHPMFNGDTVLNESFRVVADYMRDKYLEVKEESNA